MYAYVVLSIKKRRVKSASVEKNGDAVQEAGKQTKKLQSLVKSNHEINLVEWLVI